MSLVNGRKLDTTYVCKRFANNPQETLEDIANDFGISYDKFVEKLGRTTDSQEGKSVKQMINEDKERQKRRKKKQEQTNNGNTGIEEQEKEMANEFSTQMEYRTLLDEIKIGEQKIASYNQQLAELIGLEEKSEKCISEYVAQSQELENRIRNIEAQLETAKKALSDIQETLDKEREEHTRIGDTIDKIWDKKLRTKEGIDFMSLRLEELSSRMINLISPSYDLRKLPQQAPGRFISSVELDDIELEVVNSDIETMGLDKVFELISVSEISDKDELRRAYEFAWLVCSYQYNSEFDVHIYNDDEKIQRLIDWFVK